MDTIYSNLVSSIARYKYVQRSSDYTPVSGDRKTHKRFLGPRRWNQN